MPLAFRYSRNQFELHVPSVIQTPGAEFEPGRRGSRLYRLDQPGNPRGDTAEESALFDRQFIQIPNGRQMPVHIYSMPEGGARRQAQARDSARHRIRPRPTAPGCYASGDEGRLDPLSPR